MVNIDIKCPLCGWAVPPDDSNYSFDIITPWGDNGVTINCEQCKGCFIVNEKVTRTYETTPLKNSNKMV